MDIDFFTPSTPISSKITLNMFFHHNMGQQILLKKNFKNWRSKKMFPPKKNPFNLGRYFMRDISLEKLL